MAGLGPTEIVIVGLILLVLFGPTLVAFFLGYTLGKKKGAEAAPETSSANAMAPPAARPDVETPGAVDTPTPDLQEKQPDE